VEVAYRGIVGLGGWCARYMVGGVRGQVCLPAAGWGQVGWGRGFLIQAMLLEAVFPIGVMFAATLCELRYGVGGRAVFRRVLAKYAVKRCRDGARGCVWFGCQGNGVRRRVVAGSRVSAKKRFSWSLSGVELDCQRERSGIELTYRPVRGGSCTNWEALQSTPLQTVIHPPGLPPPVPHSAPPLPSPTPPPTPPHARLQRPSPAHSSAARLSAAPRARLPGPPPTLTAPTRHRPPPQ